jgi:hypothetical protein
MPDKKLGLLDQFVQGAKGLGSKFLDFAKEREEASIREQQRKDDYVYGGDPNINPGGVMDQHGYGNDPSIRPQDAFTRENMSPEMVDYLTNYFGQNGLDDPAKFLMHEFNYLNQDLRKDIYNLFQDNYKAPPVPLFDRKPGIGL